MQGAKPNTTIILKGHLQHKEILLFQYLGYSKILDCEIHPQYKHKTMQEMDIIMQGEKD